MSRKKLLAILFVLFLAAASIMIVRSISRESASDVDRNIPSQITAVVELKGSAFIPETLSIKEGDSVEWLLPSATGEGHIVIGPFDKPKEQKKVTSQENYTYKFVEAGEYTYFLSNDPNINGTIQVTAAQ